MQELDESKIVQGSSKRGRVSKASEAGLESLDPTSASISRVAPAAIHDSRAPGYPAITPSRVLHPYHDPYPYHEAILAVKRVRDDALSNPQSGSEHGFIVDEDPGLDDRLVQAQRRLKFLDPGKVEAMHKRLASPRTVGGILNLVNSFNMMPVKTSLRNTELFHFCTLPIVESTQSDTLY